MNKGLNQPASLPEDKGVGPWQRLVEALPELMQDRELDKQLTQLSDLFSRCFEHFYVDWHWRGRRYAKLHPVCPEQFRYSCNNLLSARVFGDASPDQSTRQVLTAWLQAAGDVLASHGRTQLSRADFHALAEIKVMLGQAQYIQAANQYVELFDRNGGTHLYRVNLHQVEAMFGDILCRVHRSYLVAPDAVEVVERKRNGRYTLKLGEVTIPVGDSHLEKLRDRCPKWFSQRAKPRPLQTWLYPKGEENDVKLTG
ncbi:LytTR family transcriptional regulator [Marinobacter hydrocarbonoclasticus]|nr:LytTR family transcriptional regulator [Marinobacter nauticus]